MFILSIKKDIYYSVMSDSSFSSIISHFAEVRTGHNWREGDVFETCKIVSRVGPKFNVVSNSGQQFTVEISDIRKLIPVTKQPLYHHGQLVLAVVYYHQKDGETYGVCRVESVSQFCNDINYVVRVIKTGEMITVPPSYIKRIVTLVTPKFAVGQYVGVKHIDGHPNYFDEYIKNGTILSVSPDHDRCTYNIKYDDGTLRQNEETEITPPFYEKSQAEKERDYEAYLLSEEQRLLQQLKNVRSQMPTNLRH